MFVTLRWLAVLTAPMVLLASGCATTSEGAPTSAGSQPSTIPADVPRAPEGAKRSVSGDWYSSLKVPGGTLRLKLTIVERADGALRAIMVSIDQGGTEIPVTKVALQNDRLHLDLMSIAAVFDGTVRSEGEQAEIVGTWAQGGATLPVTFKRLGKPGI